MRCAPISPAPKPRSPPIRTRPRSSAISNKPSPTSAAAISRPSKSVVTAAEMTRILEEMGPVEGDARSAARRGAAGAAHGSEPRRRLYRIKDRAMIAGVCSGIGAYFDIDPNIVRLLCVLVGALHRRASASSSTSSLMFAIPSAHTSEEWAAAHGVPFNAQEVIDRAKREYGKFADDSGKSWRAEMRRRRREWREQQRDWSSSFGGWDAASPRRGRSAAGAARRAT